VTTRLRIFTANLWNGRAKPDPLARQLDALRVDVCAVQELTPDQASAISGVLPHGKLEPAVDHSGMGIALRQPGEVSSLPLPARPARVARIEPGGWPQLARPLEVLNLHVQAPHVFPVWRAMALRRATLRQLLAYLDEAEHPGRVLVGDLNSTPVWPFYRGVASRLRDAAVEHATRRRERPAPTWGPIHRSPRLLRIDHAFVADLHVDHCQVVPIAGSDHSAVVLDLEAF